MPLSLDVVRLGVPEVSAAHAFYSAAFSASDRDHGEEVRLDLRGAGVVDLCGADTRAPHAHSDPATEGFPGWVLNYIVSQPSEVEILVAIAARHGAKVLKPPKKGFFGGFTAVVQAPEGTIWKLAAPTRKDTGPAEDPPTPTEIVTILGVAEPKASKAFYEALGMAVERDYGSKFVDFSFRPGTFRLGLMPRRELAKDAGTDADGDGFRAMVLHYRAESRDEVDGLLSAAVSAGGRSAVPAGETDRGGYCGQFADPDGVLWTVGST